ncbi:MAG: NAD(+) diphosphatase [Gammaproteobacteria bacterium]|nr:NAD(+) diphosphatase [Gammaproteobacteria bacterium]
MAQNLYYCGDHVLLEIIATGHRVPVFFAAPAWLEDHRVVHRLGMHDEPGFNVVEVSGPKEIPRPYVWVPLRAALEAVFSDAFNLLVRAHQVINWDKNHRYCGRCGTPTQKNDNGFEKQCPSCRLLFYPRISPSIIVLIRKDNEILLARKADFLPNVYGLIAGFVEVGESLEQTVEREVYEEVGLQVNNIQYFDSQPWPFPDSLMIAFTADYVSGEIVLRDGELEVAGWYTVDNLPGLPSSSISISRKLIDDFIAKQKTAGPK